MAQLQPCSVKTEVNWQEVPAPLSPACLSNGTFLGS